MIKGYTFQQNKRKANCCSIFTYWYANSLVSSVTMNNGKMDEKMIEDMNTDPKRDKRLVLNFHTVL